MLSSMSAPDRPAPSERVLLVDDEPDLRELVSLHLEEAGFEVLAVETGQAALDRARDFAPAVVVLDLMLPDIPGPEVCRRLRADPDLDRVAVLMLTARSDEYDRVLGFEVGADDYVTKPFSVRELVHRVRALVRRFVASAPTARELLTWRGLSVDAAEHVVTVDGAPLQLRPLEFRLLVLFLQHPREVLTRAQLLSRAWGISAPLQTRTVDTHVRRLREALGVYGDAIETVVGFGYRLREP
jgi:two-component system phosphate regulon response regulator PhoB